MRRAGLLRQRVTIRKPTTTTADDGQVVENWTDPLQSSVPAQVEAISGSESNRRAQVEPDVTTIVKLRFRTDLLPTYRIEHQGRLLGIVSVYDPTGLRRELWLNCKEVV